MPGGGWTTPIDFGCEGWLHVVAGVHRVPKHTVALLAGRLILSQQPASDGPAVIAAIIGHPGPINMATRSTGTIRL